MHSVLFILLDLTSQKQKFQGTILFPEYTHGVKSKPETQTTSARSLETIASRLNAKSPHNVVVGQMRVVLFGKALGNAEWERLLLTYNVTQISGVMYN